MQTTSRHTTPAGADPLPVYDIIQKNFGPTDDMTVYEVIQCTTPNSQPFRVASTVPGDLFHDISSGKVWVFKGLEYGWVMWNSQTETELQPRHPKGRQRVISIRARNRVPGWVLLGSVRQSRCRQKRAARGSSTPTVPTQVQTNDRRSPAEPPLERRAPSLAADFPMSSPPQFNSHSADEGPSTFPIEDPSAVIPSQNINQDARPPSTGPTSSQEASIPSTIRPRCKHQFQRSNPLYSWRGPKICHSTGLVVHQEVRRFNGILTMDREFSPVLGPLLVIHTYSSVTNRRHS